MEGVGSDFPDAVVLEAARAARSLVSPGPRASCPHRGHWEAGRTPLAEVTRIKTAGAPRPWVRVGQETKLQTISVAPSEFPGLHGARLPALLTSPCGPSRPSSSSRMLPSPSRPSDKQSPADWCLSERQTLGLGTAGPTLPGPRAQTRRLQALRWGNRSSGVCHRVLSSGILQPSFPPGHECVHVCVRICGKREPRAPAGPQPLPVQP